MRGLLLFLCSFGAISAIQVQLSTGTIEGTQFTATYSPFGNQTATVFLGIPYATPPLGELRFRNPVPPKKWDGVLETKEYKAACLSNMTRTYKNGNIGGPIDEDCLYVNVFTNEYCMEKKNCAVMIVIHGGGFLFESAVAFKKEVFVNNFVGQNRNIIVVSVSYRLGVMGFGQLNGKHGASAGDNVGLYDVLQAVKWTNKEIHNFGGDKKRITLAGHSAGAMITNHITLSPLSKGLINQQIIMSGAIPNDSKLANYKPTTAVAIRVGCLPEDIGYDVLSYQTIDKAYDCMRKVDQHTMLDAELFVLKNTSYYFGMAYVDGTMVPDYSDNIFSHNTNYKINTMVGTVTAELRDTQYLQYPNGTSIERRVEEFCEHFGYEIAFSDPVKFTKMCKGVYMQNGTATYLSDDMEFYATSIKMAEAHLSPATKVYMYSYSYTLAGDAFDKYLPQVPSPMHSEDLIYTFGTHRGTFKFKDYIIEQIYSGFFANFVNFGDPSTSETQKWQEYTKEGREYFHIDFDRNFAMPGPSRDYYPRANQFWNVDVPRELGPKHYIERFPRSQDTLIASNIAAAIQCHEDGTGGDQEKGLVLMEKIYEDYQVFLREMKKEWRKKTRIVEVEGEGNGTISLLLLIFGGILFAIMIYFGITRLCLSRRNPEYQPL